VTIAQDAREFFTERPLLADIATAAAITTLHLVGLQLPGADDDRAIDALAIALVVVPGALTVFRRTRPIPALAVATVLGMSYWVLDYSGAGSFLAIVVLLYSAAVYASDRRRSTQVLIVFTIALLAVLIAGYVSPVENEVSLGVIVFNIVLFQFAWLAGDAVRNRRAEMKRLHDQMETAEFEQTKLTEHAVEAERNRIARELHDIVAHSMSVIVVQAEGARRLIGKDDESVQNALLAIEQTGRANLNDIRGIVGLLRTDGTEYAPSPELSQLDRLVQQCSDAGLNVSLDVLGTPRALPPMIELSGYRIVQESLTNAMKHAGPAATAKVTIDYHEDSIDIAVIDNGRGAAADTPSTPGHGLLGIRERVEAFGGQIHMGPRVGGGFAVEARIPLGAHR
jgi:signal transduction histidine kinase